MIHCYKDKDAPEGVIVNLEGDRVEITSDFVCIASKMLNSGIPLEILCRSLAIAVKDKWEWKAEKS